MSIETDKINGIIESYEDRERLALILKLHKAGHLNETEALSLLIGDRNYYATETIKQMSKEIKELWENSMRAPIWTTVTSPYTTGNPVVYTTTDTSITF